MDAYEKYWRRALSAVLLIAATAVAQQPATSPSADAATSTGADELARLAAGLTPEQLATLVRNSARQRLVAEREQVQAEIRDGLMYDAEKVDQALKTLNENPANTQQDNIDRTCKAFAYVEEDFGQAYALYAQGEYVQAAEAFSKLINTSEVSYLSAARSYLLAESLNKAGQALLAKQDTLAEGRKFVIEASNAYIDLLSAMPQRVSFAASAAVRCAEAFEQLGRGIYAMEMYQAAIQNYAMALEKDQVALIGQKVRELEKVYKDPMGTVTNLMGNVGTRLGEGDSGPQTRQEQIQIVSVLDDMIKTAEEKAQTQDQKSPQKKNQRKEEGKEEGSSEANKQGQGKTSEGGKKPSKAGKKPSSPAKKSMLPGGEGGKIGKLSEIHDKPENADWSELAPREKDRLRDGAKKAMDERYQDMIREYFRKMAETSNENP